MEIEKLQVEMDEVDAFIGQQPAASVLMLTDVRGLHGSPRVVDMFKKRASHIEHLRKSAVVGIGFSGPKKVLFDVVMCFSGAAVEIFDDIEKAKDWLIGS